MGRWLLDRWQSCVRALGDSFDDPASETRITTQNCWSWALKRWLVSGCKGQIVISVSPRERALRCHWAPKGDRGPLWHFEPLHPKRGAFAIWHSFLHKGRPMDMRNKNAGRN